MTNSLPVQIKMDLIPTHETWKIISFQVTSTQIYPAHPLVRDSLLKFHRGLLNPQEQALICRISNNISQMLAVMVLPTFQAPHSPMRTYRKTDKFIRIRCTHTRRLKHYSQCHSPSLVYRRANRPPTARASTSAPPSTTPTTSATKAAAAAAARTAGPLWRAAQRLT